MEWHYYISTPIETRTIGINQSNRIYKRRRRRALLTSVKHYKLFYRMEAYNARKQETSSAIETAFPPLETD